MTKKVWAGAVLVLALPGGNPLFSVQFPTTSIFTAAAFQATLGGTGAFLLADGSLLTPASSTIDARRRP